MCFKERNSKVCGNSRVEDGEECDPGLLHLNDDPCCSSDCKFKRGAQCRYEIQKAGLIVQNTFVKSKYTLKLWINWSKWGCQKILVVRVWVTHEFTCLCSLHSDRNSPCCRNCKFEKAGTRCQEAINATCKGISSCTGAYYRRNTRTAMITATLLSAVMGGFFIEMINYTYLGKLHLSVFPLHIRQQQSMSTSCKRWGQHNVCWQRPVSQWGVQPFLWGRAEPSVLCLQR